VLWVLVDIAIGVVALIIFGAVAYHLLTHLRTFARAAGEASRRVGELTQTLADAQALQGEHRRPTT
jgi:Sec-independent protein translocase protein TatA